MSRKPSDHHGHLIDAANHVFNRLVGEACQLANDGHSLSADQAVAEMVHMVAMTWIDGLADEGLVSRTNAHVHGLTKAMASLAAEADVKRARRL